MNETVPGRFSVILKWLFCAFVISLAIFQLSENIAEPVWRCRPGRRRAH